MFLSLPARHALHVLPFGKYLQRLLRAPYLPGIYPRRYEPPKIHLRHYYHHILVAQFHTWLASHGGFRRHAGLIGFQVRSDYFG